MTQPLRLKIRHSTRYDFSGSIAYGLQQLRKTPKSTRGQRVLEWRTTVEGGAKELYFEDHHNNMVELISIERETETLVVTSEGEIEIEEVSGVLGQHIGPAPLWLYERATDLTKPGPGTRALAREVSGETDLEKLHDLLRIIGRSVTYEVGASAPDWSAEDALAAEKGVCQDHTHIFLTAARLLGFPARYVSGYLMMNDRVEQDAMHAWAEAHVPDLGWVGFDVSNGISPDQRYVRVASGLDYRDAAPVTGMQTGAYGEALAVDIEVAEQAQ